MPIEPVRASVAGAFEHAREGMARGEQKLNEAARTIAKGEVSPGPMVDLIEAGHLYTANAKVVQTSDEMLGTLLDVVR